MTTATDIAGRIRTTRRALGLTQTELAAAAGVGLRFIVDLEAAKASVHLGKTLTVLETLGLTVELVARTGLPAQRRTESAPDGEPESASE